MPSSPKIAKLVADMRAMAGAASRTGATRARGIEARYGYDKYPGNCHVVPNHALMIWPCSTRMATFDKAQTIV